MSVSRNTAYNLIGGAIPVVAALVTVPLYIHLIGPERYGVLAIAWLLLGYFGFFDLGLGRATAFRIAALRDSSPDHRSATFNSALFVNVGMGLVGGGILWLTSVYYYEHFFKVSGTLRPEIVASTPWLALSVPVATLTGVLTGALQGREKFLVTNIISVTSAILFQVLPLVTSWFLGPNLSQILQAALVARFVALLMLGYCCYLAVVRGTKLRLDLKELPLLLRYGGWVTLASLIGPLVAWSDRFIIGAMIGAFAVAVYATPMQFAKQIQVLPAALTNAVFPRIAAGSIGARRKYAEDSIYNIAILTTAPVLGLIFVCGPALYRWIGPELAVPGAPVARILLIGFWLNALALVPYTTAQGSGRPDLVTKIQIFETLPYFVVIYLGVRYFGVVGAAYALLFRNTLDYILLSWFCDRQFFGGKFVVINLACLAAGALLATRFEMRDWAWWVGLVVLEGVTVIVAWKNLPDNLKRVLESFRRLGLSSLSGQGNNSSFS